MKNQIVQNIGYPFLLEKDGIYVIVNDTKDGVIVLCPFPSCKVGFVDILDKMVASAQFHYDVQYHRIDEFLNYVKISECGLSAHTAYSIVSKSLDSLVGQDMCIGEVQMKYVQEFKALLVNSGIVQYFR